MTSASTITNRTYTISVKGKPIEVPCLQVGGLRIVTTGKLLRHAVIHDEEWLSDDTLGDPLQLIEALSQGGAKADLFSFAQRISEGKPKYDFHMDWDNAAVIPITTYADWWEKLPQVARRNVRTAAKKGIEVRLVPFDEVLIEGIKNIYDEAPTRLGKPFWHYGKDLATIKKENGTYADRSDFIGAFHEGKLIGFIKIVYVDRIGSMMQILSMAKHQDKRTTNAMVGKAVEVCAAKGMAYLMYCKYVYGTNEASPLTDFKKRNGFERLVFPRYYVPLTLRGRLALALRLHHGIKGLLPPFLLNFALHLRARYYMLKSERSQDKAQTSESATE